MINRTFQPKTSFQMFTFRLSICLIAFWFASQSHTEALAQNDDVPSHLYSIGDDGTIWASTKKSQLVGFHDGKWKRADFFDDLFRPSYFSVTGGRDGVALVNTGSKYFICQPGEETIDLIASGSLHQLLEDHTELMKNKFARLDKFARLSYSQQREPRFCFTQNGKIWCSSHGSVHVFDGEVWHDATDALISKGMFPLSHQLAAVGDERVFINCSFTSGKAVLGELADGKFQFTSTLGASSRFNEGYFFYDNEGVLWLKLAIRSLGPGSYRALGPARIPPDQPLEVVDNAGPNGFPRLSDASGNTWLVGREPGERKESDEVKIWKAGKIVQRVTIPGYSQGLNPEPMFSDRPGSVYAKTKSGFQHLIADGPDFENFELVEELSDPKDLNRPKFLGYSSQGWLVYRGSGKLHLRALSTLSPVEVD